MSREIFENDYRKKFIPGGYSFRLVTDPVDRAHLTFYRLKFCFGGKYSTGGFQVSSQNRNIIKELSAYRNSLREFSRIGGIFKNTVIENHDFLKIISLYGNKRDTVLFIDPPYFNKGDYYVGGFSHGQHEFLAHALAECDAPVVCTFYDCSELRDLYPQRYWNYDHVKATKNVSGARSPKSRSSVEMILTKKGQGEMISDGIKK